MVQALGESKIASMMESKEFRKGIVQLEWEHKKNLMQIEDLKNKMRVINMMKVTREIQSYLNEEDHEAKVAQEVNILEQTILMQKRVGSHRGHKVCYCRAKYYIQYVTLIDIIAINRGKLFFIDFSYHACFRINLFLFSTMRLMWRSRRR